MMRAVFICLLGHGKELRMLWFNMGPFDQFRPSKLHLQGFNTGEPSCKAELHILAHGFGGATSRMFVWAYRWWKISCNTGRPAVLDFCHQHCCCPGFFNAEKERYQIHVPIYADAFA